MDINTPSPEDAARLELENHLAECTERLIAEGWSPEAAQREARRRLGDPDRYERRLARSSRSMARSRARRRARADWLGDLRWTFRRLLNRPAFFFVGTLVLALGLGMNAAVFSVVEDVLLDAPAYEDPDELVLVWARLAEVDNGRIPMAGPDVERLREGAEGLDAVAFVGRVRDGTLGTDLPAPHVRIGQASADLFETLGVRPSVGRWFEPLILGDSTAVPEVVLSAATFREVLGSQVEQLGRVALLNGQPVVPVGVLSSDFALGSAQRQVESVAERLRQEVPEYEEAGLRLELRPLHRDATEHARGVLLAVYGGVGALVVVVWLNLITLWLGRLRAARPDMLVRLALGGAPARIARQYGLELVVVSLAGGVLGLLLAGWATLLVSARLDPALAVQAGTFGAVGYYGMAWTLTVAVLLGVHLARCRTLRVEHPGSTGRVVGSPIRRGLIVAQVGAAVVLVATVGLLVRSAELLTSTDPGFVTSGATTFGMSIRAPGAFGGPSDRARLVGDVGRALRDLPGVTAVGLANRPPFADRPWTQPFGVGAEAESEWAGRRADFRTVTSDYFDAMGIRLLAGRSFTAEEDVVERDRVAVVDERIARMVAPEGNAIGLELGFPLDGAPVRARIVGVVEPVRYDGLRQEPRGSIYVPYRQEASRDVVFVARAERALAAEELRAAVASVSPLLAVYQVRSLGEIVGREIRETEALVRLIGIFALIGLTSAAVGLYGLLSLDVSRRGREIGIRMALGAERGRVLRGVVFDGLRVTILGLSLGAFVSVGFGRALGSVLFGVSLMDPATWLAVAVVLMAAATVAAWLPARRAASADPTEALRSE